jgi:hypothetical protein
LIVIDILFYLQALDILEFFLVSNDVDVIVETDLNEIEGYK